MKEYNIFFLGSKILKHIHMHKTEFIKIIEIILMHFLV